MPHEFRLQDPGEGIHEAEIIEIHVNKGDRVAEGDDVIVAETDKAAVDIPAPVSGEVQEVRVAVGDIVNVGDVLMVFAEDGDDAAEKDADADGKEHDRSKAGAESGKDQDDDRRCDDAEPEPSADAETAKGGQRRPEGGRGSSDDDDEAEDEDDKQDGGDGVRENRDPDTTRAKSGGDDVRATPAVRGLARELGVDLGAVTGSGEDGRILESDVRTAADQTDVPERKRADEAATGDDETVVELRSVRRTTARRMEQSWREIPHVTHHDVIEITTLERLRQEHAAEIEERGGALSLTPFLVKALAIALAEFPNFNATFDAEARAVHRKRRIDVGVALDTERGLLVPVLRGAGRASIADLAIQLHDLAKRLREGSARPEDLRGATFTLTNIGAIGGTGLAPIINPPQTAIFGAARAELRQVMRGDLDDHHVEVALCLPVCLTFDHRVADGAEAARFVNAVRDLLADPGRLMLHS